MSRFLSNLIRPFFQQVREFPKPGKTHKGAAKRFTRATKYHESGLIYRSRQGASHLNIKKDSARRSRLSRPALVSKADRKRMITLLGGRRGGF